MTLSLLCERIPDPDGHNPALLLKGDWLVVQITDGRFTGWGESSHSRNDERCERVLRDLFDEHVKHIDLSLGAIKKLESGPFSTAGSFVEATAISGINQALYDLLARREGIPVWRLFSDTKRQGRVPVYATVNRALTSRTQDDYIETVGRAMEQGFAAIKCAPFEMVQGDGNEVQQSRYGLTVLRSLRECYPDLSIRIDFHERFKPEDFTQILPELLDICPHWLEAPIPIGPGYSELQSESRTPIALGELFFGRSGFREIVDNSWADVIMPDVKHVGGFGPLVDVVEQYAGKVQVSPHNPAGPVSTLASVHVAAICNDITSLEMPLILDSRRAYYLKWMDDGCLKVPDGAGWGDWSMSNMGKQVESARALYGT